MKLLNIFNRKNKHQSQKRDQSQRPLNLLKNKDINDEKNFVLKRQDEKIGIKSSLIEYAALQRNIKVNRLNSRLLEIELPNGKSIAFHNMNGISSSRVGMSLCDSKYDAMKLMKKNGVPVTKVNKFNKRSYEEALDYVEEIGFPVVVKPTSLSRSRGITTNIRNFDEFEAAWDNAYQAYTRGRNTRSVLVEKHVQGEDYRFFVVDNEVVSATHRKRANVIGDGSSTILELIQKKNEDRKSNPYLSRYPVSEDLKELDGLEEQGLTFDSVPKENEEVRLHSTSNPAAGRDSVDVTDKIHPGYREVAVKALESIPGMGYAGVDIIAEDITSAPTSSNHVIGEIESSPAPLTHFPIRGKARDMAGAIVEYYLRKYNQ